MSRSVRGPDYGLRVFEKHPVAEAYKISGAYEPYAIVATDKRFTDAELAAEYYAQDSRCRHEQWMEAVRGDDDYEDWERAMQSRMYYELTMFHRFATLPSYDE